MADNPSWKICERAAGASFPRKPFLSLLAAAALLTWCLSCGSSGAEVRLSGTQDHVVLQTHEASMEEILTALRSTFDLEVSLEGATVRKFTGVYTGSVRKVLSRLLMGYDYVLRSASNGISIRLVGNSAADSSAAPSNLPLAAPGSRLVALRQGRLKRRDD
jgi:hypothetical protein